MRSFHMLNEVLLRAAGNMADLLTTARDIPGLSGANRKDWEKTCQHISRSISEDRVRVAVVGSIKSGKSTFINAFLKGDYLKRGAGVVTSIVTRVRKGQGLKATLYFKSWEEIHSDLEHAMVLLPSMPVASEAASFDFRQAESRSALQAALAALGPDRLIKNGTRNESSVLMASYLKGFESVKDIISTETVVRYYEGEEFALHRDFVGNDALAVYLKDIEIEINADILDSNLEVADCQGSDSPNPLHLAMIQDYLLLTHLIIYVISSRTGLRRADIRFLSMIQKMGLAEHILFVVNCDFSEHDSVDGLLPLIERIREEISLIKPSPTLYTLSSLYNLFKNTESNLSEKDHMRLLQWRKEEALAALSDGETRRFMTDFDEMLLHERYALLLRNPVERLTVISAGVDHWIDINLDMLNRDSVSAVEMLKKIKRHEAKILHLKTMMESTLNGALQKIRQDLKADVDRFFDIHNGEVLSGMLRFISQYSADIDPFQEKTSKLGFTQALFLVFQEFKQSLDAFVTESTMPEVIRFVREEEAKIAAYLLTIAAPYDGLLQDALSDYSVSMSSLGFTPIQDRMDPIRIPELDAIKSRSGLRLPPAGITLRYSARIKTEAIVKLGCYTLVTLVKRLLKKSIQNCQKDEIHALKDGVDRMKRETERSIVSHFKDYRENLKFQYIFKLADAAFQSLLECLMDRFEAYSTDISRIAKWADGHQIDKDRVSRTLEGMRLRSREITEQLKSIREQMDHESSR
ncbi:MAG: dynamin family protein [Deltaproteobacteria bacterium]|nr:dynamin family protein [Deltaproteobacteria bacterium]